METVLEPLKVAIREETLRTMTHSFDLPSVNLDFDLRHATSMKWEKHKDPYFFLVSCTSHIFHFTHYQAQHLTQAGEVSWRDCGMAELLGEINGPNC